MRDSRKYFSLIPEWAKILYYKNAQNFIFEIKYCMSALSKADIMSYTLILQKLNISRIHVRSITEYRITCIYDIIYHYHVNYYGYVCCYYYGY